MAGFKAPDFNERKQAARAAKQRAVEQLRNKPAPDPAKIAERKAASEAREQRRAARAEEKKAEAERAEAEKAEALKAEAEAEAEKRAAAEREVTERKAARDARYAARKARQR